MKRIDVDSGGRERVWLVPEGSTGDVAAGIQEATSLPYAISFCLGERGLIEKEQIRAYLKPDPRKAEEKALPIPTLHDPLAMKDVGVLVDRLIEAKAKGERILIHGDYDVDGLTSTTLLTRVLGDLGFGIEAVVPDRHVDGYGMSERILDQAIADGVDVVLTCDVGIAEAEKVARLAREGVTVLVTDHHHVPEDDDGNQIIPPAHAVVCPQQADCAYPFPELCGVGVAFKVLQALARKLDLDEVEVLYPYLDLVALGTIADVVSLTDENRILVHAGLPVMREAPNPGIKALLDAAKIAPSRVDAGACAFQLSPRLNAIGRLDKASIGLTLLLTDDPEEAESLALDCDQANVLRKKITERIERDAVAQVEAMGDLSDVWALALFGDAWHHGIVGIVASRIVECYGRPAFLFARDSEGHWKGSGRANATETIDLYEIVAACKEHMAGFGGHPAAAGGALKSGTEEAARAFADAFNAAAAAVMTAEDRIPKIRADMEIELGDVDMQFYKYLRMFEPHGEGNRPILFLARDVEVREVLERGEEGIHLKFTVRQGDTSMEGIAFRIRERIPELIETPRPYRADLLFYADLNVWNGRASLQMHIQDARILTDADGHRIETEAPAHMADALA